MDCEICGQENAKNHILMYGQKMLVCIDCSNLGERVIGETVFSVKKNQEFSAAPAGFAGDFFLAKGFGQIIRSARQKNNLTLNELAQKIFEKESFLHKIEQEKMFPDKKLAKKLESALNIKIVE
ncbi:MAG: TIGR00270 family protein [Candidatus Diapherotrites archaeon]|nr:TIGR00270 family protein [Candidatus Diapherotrites archaeon]